MMTAMSAGAFHTNTKGGCHAALWHSMESQSDAQRSGLCRGVALFDGLPVHRVPPRLEIVGAAVLVAGIIGGPPDVVAKQCMLAVHHGVVLVRTGLERKLAVLRDRDKGPARTQHLLAGGVEIGPQFFHPGEV